jgi:hypothetical protein
VYAESRKKELIRFALGHYVEDVTQLWKKTADLTWAAERMRQWQEIDSKQRKEEYSDSINEWNATFLNAELRKHYANTAIDLMRMAALCKHRTFHEEQEWRLTLPVETGRTLQSTKRRLRLRGTTEVPYLDVRLNHDGSDVLPLKEVVMGPGTASAERLVSINSILKTAGYEVPVRVSDSPFRP